MLVRNTGIKSRVLLPNSTSYEGILGPGDVGEADPKNPSVAIKLKAGVLAPAEEEVAEKEEIVPKEAPIDKEREDLSDVNVQGALSIIASEDNDDILQQWLEVETRITVVRALKEKLEL